MNMRKFEASRRCEMRQRIHLSLTSPAWSQWFAILVFGLAGLVHAQAPDMLWSIENIHMINGDIGAAVTIDGNNDILLAGSAADGGTSFWLSSIPTVWSSGA
jgi:hypothetical protein